MPGTIRDKKLLQFQTRRKGPKTDPHLNPMQHMPSQPFTNIQSQIASRTMNLIWQIYIPVFSNLINQTQIKTIVIVAVQSRKLTVIRFKL